MPHNSTAAPAEHRPLIRSKRARLGEGNLRVDIRITSALEKLDRWIEDQGFRGWDPHDGLNSPLLRFLSLRARPAGIVWLQLLKRCPVNLRGMLGIAKSYNPKGMGLFLASYVRKYRMTGDERHCAHIAFLAQWLLSNSSTGYEGLSWGYNFDWPNRSFFAPAGTPTIVNTAFIGLAFLDLYLLLGKELNWSDLAAAAQSTKRIRMLPSCTGAASGLEVARQACDFILKSLNIVRPSPDELCFSYTPLDQRLVHNANMVGARLLAAVFRQTGEPHLRAAALAAARFTSRRQLQNGAWQYGETSNDRWVDNFHTGFVLLALKQIRLCLQTDEFDKHLLAGYQFWKDQMFLPNGAPKYYPTLTYPIDIHSVAQAIITFLEFSDDDCDAVECASRTAVWGINTLQDPTGYFYYQVHRHYTIRIPYIRWAQAWMQRALVAFVYALSHDLRD